MPSRFFLIRGSLVMKDIKANFTGGQDFEEKMSRKF